MRHADELRERALALHAHGLVVLAGVRPAHPAGVALAAIEVGQHADLLADRERRPARPRRGFDLARDLVAGMRG